MAIHTNKSYKNTDNMINYSIIVESKYISNNMSTHIIKKLGQNTERQLKV
jgi:hypothetical protein